MSLIGKNGKEGEESLGEVKNRVDSTEVGMWKGWVILNIIGLFSLVRR